MVKKSICIITTIDNTITAFIIPVARELQRNGYSVTFISSMQDSFIEKNKLEFNLINLPMERGAKPIGMIKSIIAIYKILRREQFDLIQYATPNAAFYGSIASFLVGCKKRLYCQWGIRYVGFDCFRRRIFKLLEKITCRLSTHIRPASRKNMEFAISEGLYHSNKAAVIGDGGTIGVDTSIFNFNCREEFKEDILNSYPILKDRTIFGFIGRLDKDKGVNELFEAFINLYNENKDIALLVLGGYDKPEGIDKQLLQKIKEIDSVIFTGHTNKVVNYLGCMDMLVHPSYREGFSMVIQQAMFMGVAIITTDIPGPSEVIENAVSGLLVKVKDSESLANGMRELLNNKAKTEIFAHSGLLRAQSLFTRERMVALTMIDRECIINN